MQFVHIPANEYQRTRWKNGFGWTREIARSSEGNEQWDWRLSIAEIEKDAPFSEFAGVDRELVLLSGNGMHLHFTDGDSHTLHPPHGALRFAGEQGVRAELIDGPTQDFNAMWRRDVYKVAVLHRPIVGPMVFFREVDVHWALYVISGQVQVKDIKPTMHLMQSDSGLILPTQNSSRLIIDGGGELLLIKFTKLLVTGNG
jgi:uncharacterized protein